MRRIWSFDPPRGAPVVVLTLLILCIGVAVLVGGVRDSSGAVAAAKERRATVESLERESTRIEIAGWRIWRSEGEFGLTPRVAVRALALVEQTELFYARRARVAPTDERSVAIWALELLERAPELVDAARSEDSGSLDLNRALRRFPQLMEEQEAVHAQWLAVNQRQIAASETRRDRWVWAGLGASGILVLALGIHAAVLMRRNTRLQRETIAKLHQQAATDSLTGLVNQGEFHQRLGAAVEHAHAAAESMSVIVLDVDHFKRVNDAHGHQVGDRVLAEIARRILDTARTHDCVGRVGGEEFAWILPRVTERDAVEAAKRARLAVEFGLRFAQAASPRAPRGRLRGDPIAVAGRALRSDPRSRRVEGARRTAGRTT